MTAPGCFITTNYDKLLEQALIAEWAEIAFQVVNNTNLVETATIIQSRARDYVFKPHGDIDTSDSVVLTREQYRALRSNLVTVTRAVGERHRRRYVTTRGEVID